MKKIHNIILATLALFVFVPVANALDDDPPYRDDGSGICYSKTISEPNRQGVYTITLESFVTGTVTKKDESIPADIVLVLDISGSMNWNMSGTTNNHTTNYERLNAMKTAVNSFIDQIDINDEYEKYVAPGSSENVHRKDAAGNDIRLGNRIAIVTFAGSASTRHQLTALTSKQSLKTTISNLSANGGTQADQGMTNAYNILNTKTGTYAVGDDRKLRTTVLFTDGDPGNGSYWESTSLTNLNSDGRSTWNTANSVINTANNIKNMANEDKGIISRVYTVSIQADPSDYTKVYLGKTSSNYTGATRMAQRSEFTWNNNSVNWNSSDIWSNGNGTSVDTKYAFATTDADKLKEVFETIAGESGGTTIPLDETTLTEVDVVSASFALPNGASTNIGLATADCSGHQIIEGKEYLTFDPATAITDGSVTVDPAKLANNIIEVKGFDFASNFCVAVKNADGSYTGEHRGKKLVISIPIKMASDAVGGPTIETNGPGSGIYVNGSTEPLVKFVSPKVSLPVNLWINKKGLNEGESAKFKIMRTSDDPDSQTASWEYVSTVFVTRHSGQDINAPLTKVRGLPSTKAVKETVDGVEVTKQIPLVYKIVEDDWSWSYQEPGTETPTRSDLLIENPFIFTNAKKTDIDKKVRYAESKVTNTFMTGKGAAYDDSKNNNRTVITVTTEESDE